jgi:hypothetical protein
MRLQQGARHGHGNRGGRATTPCALQRALGWRALACPGVGFLSSPFPPFPVSWRRPVLARTDRDHPTAARAGPSKPPTSLHSAPFSRKCYKTIHLYSMLLDRSASTVVCREARVLETRSINQVALIRVTWSKALQPPARRGRGRA